MCVRECVCVRVYDNSQHRTHLYRIDYRTRFILIDCFLIGSGNHAQLLVYLNCLFLDVMTCQNSSKQPQ